MTAQLQQRHHISLNEFITGSRGDVELKRYDRTAYLKLPKVDFYQLKVSYETTLEEDANPARDIPSAAVKCAGAIVRTTDFSLENLGTDMDDEERGTEPAVFSQWLYGLTRSGIGFLSIETLNQYQGELRSVFESITYERGGVRYFSSKYDRPATEANIRKAFCQKRDFERKTEHIPEEASLLNIANFKPVIHSMPDKIKDYYPVQSVVENIMLDDAGKFKIKPDILTTIQTLE